MKANTVLYNSNSRNKNNNKNNNKNKNKETRQNAERGRSTGRIAIGQFWSHDWSAFCHFSSSLYTTIIPNPNADPNPNTNPNPNPYPNPNPTVITYPQIGPIDPQIVTIQIRPADPLRSAFCPKTTTTTKTTTTIILLPVFQNKDSTTNDHNIILQQLKF